MTKIKLFLVTTVLCTALFPISASAHHSYAATFDLEQKSQIEGEVVDVGWKNPHITFDVKVVADDGSNEIYNVESHSLSILKRMNMDEASFVQVGDKIKVSGNPARKTSTTLFALNILMPSGQEVVMDPWGKTIWGEAISSSDTWVATEDQAEASEAGFFRVWSTSLKDPRMAFHFPGVMNPASVQTYPLTDSARAVAQDYDLVESVLTANCAVKGMPAIMGQPYPIEIGSVDGNINIRIEEHDLVRTIYLTEPDAPPMPSLMGYSVGRIEANVLYVETSHMSWGHFDTVGVPLSEDATVAEKFTLSSDGKRLDHELIVTDPATFTEPFKGTKFWLAIPGVAVEPFECEI